MAGEQGPSICIDSEILLFPNPVTNEKVTIKVLNNRLLGLRITDIGGRLVREQALVNGLTTISLSG